MICPYCGNETGASERFCTVCGAQVSAELVPTAVQTQVEPPNATKILVFGIISVAVGTVVGIIFGSIAMHMAQDWMNQGYLLFGKAKVGRILGKVGLILGIVSTVCLTLFIIIYCVLLGYLVSEFGSYRYY